MKTVMNWFRRLIGKRGPTSLAQLGRVEYDTESIRFHHPEGDIQSIRWTELDEVGVVTTDEGPFSEDVFFMLLSEDRKRRCVVPQGADGIESLLSQLQALPGFDNRAFIDAMGCTANRNFRLWKKR